MSTTQTYTVTGMTCDHCVASVTEEVQEIPGVENVDVVLETGSLTVTSAGRSTTPRSRPRSRKPDTSSHERSREAARVPRRARCHLRRRQPGSDARSARWAPPPPTMTAWAARASTTWPTWPSPTPPAFPKGLMVSQNGYSFRLDQDTVSAGDDVPVSFTIEGPDGSPITEYDEEHEKELHLIAVRRDFYGLPARAPGAGRGRHVVDVARPHSWSVARVRRLQGDRCRGDHPGQRPRGARRLPAGGTGCRDADRDGRRLHRHPRRRPSSRARRPSSR